MLNIDASTKLTQATFAAAKLKALVHLFYSLVGTDSMQILQLIHQIYCQHDN